MNTAYLNDKFRRSIGSALRIKLFVREVLHPGDIVTLGYRTTNSTMKSGFYELAEVIAVTEHYLVFKGLKTGIKKAYDYIDVYRGFKNNHVAMEPSYENGNIVIRRENGEYYV